MNSICTLAPGKQADIVVVKGNPSAKPKGIENVQFVYKDGIAFDSAKLIEANKGTVGLR